VKTLKNKGNPLKAYSKELIDLEVSKRGGKGQDPISKKKKNQVRVDNDASRALRGKKEMRGWNKKVSSALTGREGNLNTGQSLGGLMIRGGEKKIVEEMTGKKGDRSATFFSRSLWGKEHVESQKNFARHGKGGVFR